MYVASDEDASSSKAESAGHVVVILDGGNDGPPGPNGEISMPVPVRRPGGGDGGGPSDVRRDVGASGQIPRRRRNHGEITPNCIGMDGSVRGEYDNALMNAVSGAVSIPVIASGGAGNEGHLRGRVRENGGEGGALAAGMFHRREVEIGSVKRRMEERGDTCEDSRKGLGDCLGEGSSGAKGVGRGVRGAGGGDYSMYERSTPWGKDAPFSHEGARTLR